MHSTHECWQVKHLGDFARLVRFLARLTVFGALAYSIGKVAAVTLRAALDDPTVYGCIGFVAVVVLVATFRAEFRDVH